MSSTFRLVTLAALAGVFLLPAPPAAQTTARPSPVRIGTFDSRSVAMAYYNTEAFRSEIRAMQQDLQGARAAKDARRIEDLEYKGTALQNLGHYQVFSTASIPNVLDKLKDVLPQVARDAGVSMIVSKWEIAWRDPAVEYIDVTDRLVEPFHPDARVRKWIESGKSVTPLPLVEAVTTLRPEK